MTDELFFDGARYVSAADAAGLSNFTRDYIARLAREGKILGKQVGRNWYVDQESLRSFILAQEYANSERREALTRERQQEYGRSQSAAPLKNASASEIGKPTVARTLASAGTASDLHRKLKESAMRAGSQVVSKANTLASSASAQTSLYAASPAFELVHKIAAAVLALVLVVGLYTADGSLLSSSPNFTGTGVTPNAELGAATGGFAAAFAGLASTFVHGIDALVAPLYGAQPAGNSQQGVVAVQVTQKALNTPAPGSNTIAVSTGPVTQTTVVNPIVERVVQSEQVISSGGITESELDQKLQQLDNSLTARIVSETAANSTAIAQNYNVTAQTNAIDNLGNVTIENPTITGGSIANAGISGGTISGATISGGTFTGTTTVEDFATTGSATSTFAAGIDLAGGCFAVNGTCISGGGGGAGNPGGSDTEVQFNDNGVFNGSSAFTFSTSTETLIVANASTTNATSTNFFAAAASFTNGMFSSLSATVASITGLNATNATTTNATTTNLYVSGELGLGSALPVSSGGTGTTSAPSYGQVLLGNSSGGYDLVSTSSLGIAGGGGNSFGYLFPNNATSTALTFSSGLLSLASTTIGNGNQNGGLTVNGGATTTGNAYFAQSVGVGTTSPSQKLSVAGNAYITDNLLLGGNATTTDLFASVASSTNLFAQTASLGSLSLGSATTTAGNGFNITAGCFAVNGVCVGTGAGSSNVSTSSQNSWSALQIFSNASSTLTTLGTTWLSGVAAGSLLSTNAAGEIAATTTIGSDLLSVPANSLLAGNSSGQLAATTSIGTNLLTGTLGIGNGGTGLNSTPSYGNLLLGNGSGYTLTATSSLGLPTFTNLSSEIAAAYEFPSNATSTALTFSSGLLSLASTTIGNGTQAGGLTIFGGATTTGASVLGGNVTFSSDNSYDIGASGANRPRNVYTAGYVLASNGLYSANDIGIDSSSNLSAPDGDGTFRISNNLGNNFDRLEFGGGTSAFPAIGRSGAGIVFELADQSGLAAIQAGNASTTLLSVGSGSATTTISAATSTFAGGIVLDSGCVQVNGSCIVSSAFTLDGSNNLFAESGALSNLTSGTNNIAAGTNALEYNTSGLYNIALGGSALLSNDNGEFNIAIGPSSLLNTDGGYNVALGEFSLRNLGSGYYNIALGSEAGANLSSGSNNILIGAGASGNGVYAPNSSGSNQLNIGNLIYGSGLDGDSATVSTGDIGIGTTSPYARFSIAGTSGGTAPLFAVASSTSLVFQIDKNGNTTIGNNGSTLTLPTVAASSLLALNSSNQVVATTSIGTDLLTGPLGTINGASFSIGGSITVSSTTLLANNNTFSGNDLFTASTTFSSLVNVANASTTVLSVSGNSYFNTAQASSFIISSLTNCSGGEALQTNSSGGLTCATVATGGASSGGGWTTNDIGSVALSTSTDRVGIGTSTPYAKLSVVSSNTATTTLALVPASGQTANILDIYNTSGALGSVFTSGDFLGLGTTSPGSILSINNSANFVNGATSTIYNGLNVTGGCVAVNGACLGATSASSTLLGDNNTFTGSDTFKLLNLSATSSSLLATNASGEVVATTSIGTNLLSGTLGVGNGGTGLNSTPSYGNLLLGNGSGYTLTATSSLGLPTFTNLSSEIAAAYEFPSNATSTTLAFNGGLTAFASSTIGNGNQSGGLTVSGGATTTGQLIVAGGAVGSAGIGFSDSSKTGLFEGAVNDIGVYQNNNEILRGAGAEALLVKTFIGATNGTLGTGDVLGVNGATAIGAAFANTTAPANGLIVQGSAGFGTSSPYAQFSIATPNGATGATTTLFAIASSTASATTTLFSISNTGNVGIGTTTPSGTFAVAGSTFLGGNVTATGTVSFTGLGSGFVGSSNGTLYSFASSSIAAASSTLLANNNTFSGNNLFTASTTFSSVVNIANASTSLASFGTIWLPNLPNDLLSTNGSGQLVATTSIGTNLLTGNLGTINGTSFTAGGSITVASTTLLANNNTFSGNNLFTASTTFSNVINVNQASTSLLTASTAWLGALNLTNALSVGNGGTGTSTAPSYGQLLLGNASSGYNLVATSSLGLLGPSSLSGTGVISYNSSTGVIGTQPGTFGGAGTYTFPGDILFNNATSTGSIVPSADKTYNLGSPSYEWENVYVGPGSLYVNGQEVVHTDVGDNVVVSSSAGENLELYGTGSTNIVINPSGTGNIQLQGPVQLTGGDTFSTSNSTPVNFNDGLEGGNLELTASTLSAVNTNGGISISPAGTGGTYFTNGDVGIGTTDPGSKLEVQGAVAAQYFNATSSSNYSTFTDGLLSLASTTIGNGTTAGGLTIFGGATTTGALVLQGATTTAANGFNITAGCFSINGTCLGGASGSGTVSSGTQGQFAFYNTTGTTVSGTSTLFVTTAGNIGVGTTSAGLVSGANKYLTIASTGVGTQPSLELAGNSSTGGGGLGRIDFYNQNSNDLDARISSVVGCDSFGCDTSYGDLVFSTDYLGTLTEAMRIDQDQNVGIGTSSPGSILAVQGVGNFVANATSTLYNSLQVNGNLVLNGVNNSLLATNGSGQIVATTSISANLLAGSIGIGQGGTGTTTGGVTNGVEYFNGTNLTNSYGFTFNGTNIGIGSTTPWANLSIQATSGQTAPLFDIASTTGAITTTSLLIAANGNVGIGTTTPGSLLSLGNTGGINFSLATSTFSSTGGINLTAGCFAVGGTCIGGGSSASSTLLANNNTFSGNNLFTASTTFSNLINVSNASTSLASFGTVWVPSLGTSAGTFLAVNSSGQVIATSTPSSSLTGTQGQVAYFSGSNVAAGTSSLYIAPSGNVGIGNTSPGYSLDVGLPSGATSTGFASVGNLLISQLEGGTFLGRTKVTQSPFVTSDSSFGTTWTQEGTSEDYSGVAISSTGQYQTAVAYGYIYVSSNYGFTWTQEGTSQNYYGVAMSSDGKYQTAVAYRGYIYISTNYGVTWTPEGTSQNYYGVAMSSDGKYQTAVAYGYIYVSTNYGVTWTQEGTSQNYNGIAMSSDGKYQTAVAYGYIYVSTNYGVTWTQEGTSQNYTTVAMSSDGKYQTAVAYGYIYVSTNYGVTWTQEGTSESYQGIAMSSDGKYQTADVYGGYLYVSTNYGVTWTQEGSSENYAGVAMSSDGKYQTAAVYGGYLYVSDSASYEAGGNVGIGTTTPGSLLSLGNTGGINFSLATSTFSSTGGINLTAGCFAVGGTCIGGNSLNLYASTTIGNGTQAGGLTVSGGATTTLNAYFASDVGIGSTTPTFAQLSIGASATKPAIAVWGSSSSTPDFVVSSLNNSGNIGYATTTPWADLSIENDTSDPGFVVASQNGTATQFIVASGGNVGIGTTSPFANLSVNTPTNDTAFAISNSVGSTTFSFSTVNTSSNIFEVASSSGSAYFDITSGGNVGIGTTSPASTFTVVGAGCFSKGATASVLCGSTAGDVYGTVFNAGAYDVAEDYVTSQASTTPGIIVGLDPANPEQVITATTSANVLGIVSTNPGVVLGGADASTANEHVVPIALSGRVPVEISLANGPINEGDRLALSSTTPGVAVKALVSGETIGIALESATSSAATSSIDVFVQPQYMTFSSPANSATSTEATSTPSALASGFFAGASTTLQQEISSLTDAFVKVFHSAVYAADGVFNKIYAQEVHTDELCISDSSGETCVTRTQLEQLLANAGTAASSSGGDSSSASGGGGVSSGDDATSSPPALQVNGANPATIDVGAVYSDLGATITGPTDDLNLGVEASVDGSTSSPQAAIQIDTSVVGTYTITYSATDQNGLVGTAERTINVVAPQASSDNDGSATSTSDQSSDASSTYEQGSTSDEQGSTLLNSSDASSTPTQGSGQADATSTGS